MAVAVPPSEAVPRLERLERIWESSPGLLGWLAHRPMADVGQAMFWTAMAGILVIIVNHLRQTNLASIGCFHSCEAAKDL